MSFDSLFDNAMKMADQAIENALASPFHLQRKGVKSVEIKAIFDSKLEYKGGDNSNITPFACEQGALTVLNQRINKDDVKGAVVATPIGERTVVDVFYPDATTSILKLSVTSEGSSGGHHGRFVRTG